MRLPDPARSRALLFGTSQFNDPGLPDLPAVRNNLADLGAFLTASAGTGLAAEHCVVLPDEPDRAVVGDLLHALTGAAEDLLLVYYSGHGVIGGDGELYLSLPGTRVDRDLVSWTGLPLSLLRRTLGGAAADNRVLILDCCFSGRAIDTMADTASAVAGQMEISGTCTLTSSPANQPAFAPAGAVYTAYTGELLRALRGEMPGTTRLLTLQSIHEHLARELPRKGFPRPEQRNTRTVAHLALAVRSRPPLADPAPDLRRDPELSSGVAADDIRVVNSPGVLLKRSGDGEGAERWFRAAAAAGDANATYDLGMLLKERGEVGEAKRWLRAAADTDHVDAIYELGCLAKNRRGFDEAVRWFQAAADAGHTEAMYKLGWLYKETYDDDDDKEVERWFRAAAECDHTDARCDLGRLLAYRGDVEEGERWLRAAADVGHTWAMGELGWLFQRRGDAEGSKHWFRALVDSGDGDTMYEFGELAEAREDAERWYRGAANAGHVKAMCLLGTLLQGRGETEEAEYWYQVAANAGHADAMYRLSLLLQAHMNTEEADRWLRAAADAGHADGIRRLGIHLEVSGKTAEGER
ncbi:caspase, EACC1-associated type [Amycolatopsis sp. cmx-4-68]|uniref:caspase, EACC1-associated type n=1 Tax=Amycolatopsis sp. cmx-4-68 TaxID=2790938 RepID=UPI003978B63F